MLVLSQPDGLEAVLTMCPPHGLDDADIITPIFWKMKVESWERVLSKWGLNRIVLFHPHLTTSILKSILGGHHPAGWVLWLNPGVYS